MMIYSPGPALAISPFRTGAEFFELFWDKFAGDT